MPQDTPATGDLPDPADDAPPLCVWCAGPIDDRKPWELYGEAPIHETCTLHMRCTEQDSRIAKLEDMVKALLTRAGLGHLVAL